VEGLKNNRHKQGVKAPCFQFKKMSKHRVSLSAIYKIVAYFEMEMKTPLRHPPLCKFHRNNFMIH
jgi:hypothetical protein